MRVSPPSRSHESRNRRLDTSSLMSAFLFLSLSHQQTYRRPKKEKKYVGAWFVGEEIKRRMDSCFPLSRFLAGHYFLSFVSSGIERDPKKSRNRESEMLIGRQKQVPEEISGGQYILHFPNQFPQAPNVFLH